MKIKSFVFIPLVALLVFVAANKPSNDLKKEEVLMEAILSGLNQMHYAPQNIDDAFSERVFDLYVKRMDGSKRFFTASDIKKLSAYKKRIDNQALDGDYDFFNLSVELMDKRLESVRGFYTDILSKPFDFTSREEVETDGDKLVYAKNEKGLKEYWRKSLKYQVLTRYAAAIKKQNDAEKKGDDVDTKTNTEIEKEAREKVLKSHNDWFKRLDRLKRSDRLNTYINAITAAYDPHTNYFPPKEKENFDISMSGQLEGIGAQLREEEGNTKVVSIVPGSASWKQGDLKAGDLIIAVAQGVKETVDVVDMPLDDVVQLIRGKKGTEVRLTVKKADGSVTIVPITRDIVIMEESYAKSVMLLRDGNESKIGYIKLPKFYTDFNGRGGRRCSDDIEKELKKLKDEGTEGIILDLRYNGGGSLRDVVDMAGLFIEEGPVVQVKSRKGRPYILDDDDSRVQYNGPLIIMVNSYSASASEILAAAMQDYGRAVIVGTSSRTFGKGTVQRFLDLDQAVPDDFADIKPLGAIKLTTQKFYRIDGGTTQLEGVVPDIVLPDTYSAMIIGEKEEDFPMKWDEIAPADYKESHSIKKMTKLRSSSEKRVKKNPSFRLIHDGATYLKQRQDKTIYPLSYKAYKAEETNKEARMKELDALDVDIAGLKVINLKADMEYIEADEARKARIDEWHKGLRSDVHLVETMNILEDMMK